MGQQVDSLLGESGAVFMARVREALGEDGGRTPTGVPAVDEATVRLAGVGDDLPGRFAERAEGLGATVRRISAVDLARHIMAAMDELQAKRVTVGVGTLPQAIALKESLRQKGFEVVDWKGQPGVEAHYDVDAGITDVHAALAETGTIICCSDAGHGRGLSLVPPNHIAIVRRSDILPDMIDYWARLRGIPSSELPSSIALISGPSKTADIEGELITGVHGPGRVILLLVEDA